jgi:hypothetical protein
MHLAIKAESRAVGIEDNGSIVIKAFGALLKK